jgi:hypothetical protein
MGCQSRWRGSTFCSAAVKPAIFPMILVIKLALVLFLLAWSGLGVWLAVKYENLFGWHPDDPSESSGARALNMTQVWSVWFGFFAVAVYFLIR